MLRIPGVKNLNYRNPSKFDLHLSDSPMVEGGHFLRYEKKLSRLLLKKRVLNILQSLNS